MQIMYRNELIKGAMAELDLKIPDVAKQADVSDFTVKAVRNGETHVSIARLKQVADVLQLPMQRLFEPKETPVIRGRRATDN